MRHFWELNPQFLLDLGCVQLTAVQKALGGYVAEGEKTLEPLMGTFYGIFQELLQQPKFETMLCLGKNE